MGTTRRGLIVTGLTGLLAACSGLSTLHTLNDLTPGDSGVRVVARDVAFGNDPLQRLDIYAPRAAAGARVLIFFYGGNWSSGRRQDYGFVARAFAARGFVVVVPDYRKVPQVHYPAFVEDGAAALAWTTANIARYGGDPARIGVSGHSAGAYIAAMLALDPRRDPAKAVKAFVGFAGPYDFYPFEPGGAAELAFGRASGPKDNQPIAHVRSTAPPSLLLTGDADTTVQPRNSIALAVALRNAGAKSEVRQYPGVGHVGIVLSLSKPFRGKTSALGDAVTFLDANL